jgi:tetratricopeptide (TPR) repeat protein
MQNKIEDGISHLRQAIQIQPNMALALDTLAWTLATQPNPKLRDGLEAVRLAKAAVAFGDDKDAGKLNTLAAAFAEAGDFPSAIATADAALKLAQNAGQSSLAQDLEMQLKLFRAGRPYRER